METIALMIEILEEASTPLSIKAFSTHLCQRLGVPNDHWDNYTRIRKKAARQGILETYQESRVWYIRLTPSYAEAFSSAYPPLPDTPSDYLPSFVSFERMSKTDYARYVSKLGKTMKIGFFPKDSIVSVDGKVLQ